MKAHEWPVLSAGLLAAIHDEQLERVDLLVERYGTLPMTRLSVP